MLDNSKDAGYITIYLKITGDECHLCEMNFMQVPGAIPFYVFYENGVIFIDKGNEKAILATYDSIPGPYGSTVYDYPSNRIIGCVGNELITFRRKDKDASVGRFFPEEECLAYYTENGNITARGCFPYYGIINGSEIGGAAAFVAIFYNCNFRSVFRDFFDMDDNSFKVKYASYLNPLGL